MSPIIPMKSHPTFLTFDQIIELAYEARVLSIDTEGYLDKNILGVSVAFRTNPMGLVSEYFPLCHVEQNIEESQKEELKILIKEHPRIVMHNAKHDLKAFEKIGVFRTKRFFDTMLMQHFVDENLPNKTLGYMAKYHGVSEKRMPPGMELIIEGLGWGYVPLVAMREYAAQDAVSTLEIFEKLIKQMAEEGFSDDLWFKEEQFTRILKKIEQRGILIDQPFIREKVKIGEKRLEEVKNELGMDPGKRADLSYLLLEKLGLPVLKRSTKTDAPSFSKDVMAEYDERLSVIEDPTAKKVFEYRGWTTALGLSYRKFLELVSPDGRLRPNFKMHGTRSSRLSSEEPNGQQIPRTSKKPWNGDMKQAFIAAEGFELVDCDYSNLELRLAAVYANDDNLTALFDDRDVNPFRRMSAELGWEYDDTKTFIYMTTYGAGIPKIASQLRWEYEKAKGYRDQFFGTYPGLYRFMKLVNKQAERHGEITYWSGRKRHLPGHDKIFFKDAPRLAFNSLLQGGGAEIMKRAMIRVDDAGLNNDDCHMVLQVHDSVVLEVRKELVDNYIPKILSIMEDVPSEESRLGRVPWVVKAKPWGSE